MKTQTKIKKPDRVIPRGFSLSARKGGAAPSLGVFGQGGTGKTLTLAGALLAGERCVGASSDFGSDGLETIVGYLESRGKGELLENLLNVTLPDWDDLAKFAMNPQDFFDQDLAAFAPTVQYLEGYSSAQLIGLEEKLVVDDMGLPEQRDWNKVKRNTLRILVRFLGNQIGDTPQAKLVTFLENVKEDEQTNKTVIGPLIQGAARNLMMPAFDIMMRTSRDKTGYVYTFRDDSSKVNVKIRARDKTPDEVKADPEQLWALVRDPAHVWKKS